ncbi:MAG: ArnT family glycosyltransferase [Flavobacteriales bacterium]
MFTWLNRIPKSIWIFTGIWFVLGVLQASLMDLHPDEAYQWQMSRHLDWGYFHHPPMIALFIKIGYALFPNELGVRLLTVFASSLGVLLLFGLSETKDAKTFLLVFLSLILTQAGVFFAAPDSALILFTLLFLILLKKYLKADSYILAALLGIVVAALMYSKYHAIVLLASAIVAAPKLLLRKSFWLIAVISIGLFVPHVLWQFDHDLISYKFNWVIREKKSWNILILLDYLLGQLILLGPVGIILIISIWKSKFKDPFDRILLAVAIGVFGFFLLMSFRGKVEANWTAVAFLPLIILGARTLPSNPKLMRVFVPISMTFAALLLVARLYLASPWAGLGIPTVFPLQGWEKWALAVKEKANGKPVFFPNSYQFTSQYSFYSGEQGYHFSPLNYNGNQFELWDIDEQVNDQTIALILGSGADSTKAIVVDGFRTMYLFDIENYRSFRNLRFLFDEKTFDVKTGETLALEGLLENNTGNGINLDSLLDQRPIKIFYYLNGSQTPAEEIACAGCTGSIQTGKLKEVSFIIQIPEAPGKYFIRFGLDFALGMPEQNSDFIQLNVVDK